jgi:hypothetical protein
MALYLYSTKLKVGRKYLYLTWCAFEHQVRKYYQHYDAGEEAEQFQNEEEKWRILEAAQPCFVASRPWTNFKVTLMLLESVW